MGLRTLSGLVNKDGGGVRLNQDKEVWLSRKELEGLLQGSVTWTDVCSRPAQLEETETICDGEDAVREDFVPRELKVTGFLTTTAVLTLVSWLYFVFLTNG